MRLQLELNSTIRWLVWYMEVSLNRGTPSSISRWDFPKHKPSILRTHIYRNPHLVQWGKSSPSGNNDKSKKLTKSQRSYQLLTIASQSHAPSIKHSLNAHTYAYFFCLKTMVFCMDMWDYFQSGIYLYVYTDICIRWYPHEQSKGSPVNQMKNPHMVRSILDSMG